MFDLLEQSEHEPVEPDPEAALRNPEEDLVPEVSVDESEVPRDLLYNFWLIVLVVNAAVFAVAFGVIWFVFVRDPPTSLGLMLGGIILFGLAIRRYRTFRRESEDDPYGTE